MEHINKGIDSVTLVTGSLRQLITVVSSGTLMNVQTGSYLISKTYLTMNITRYVAGLVGGPVTVAGRDFIITPIIVGMTSIIAVFVNLFLKRNRLLSFYFLISMIGTLYYIGTFYIVDARYLLVFIPVIILIFGIFLDSLFIFLESINRKFYTFLLLGIVYLAIIFNVTPALIDQLKINFYKPQKALNYEAIKIMNDYTNKLNISTKPLIISILSPYMVDFFSNHKYDVLPLSRNQYFVEHVKESWGIDPKMSLLDVYRYYLSVNKLVLISDYKANNKFWFYFDLQNIKEKYNLFPVAKGCDNECNLYRLEPKKN